MRVSLPIGDVERLWNSYSVAVALEYFVVNWVSSRSVLVWRC